MKKIASILLSVSIGLLSLTGCGGGKAPQRADNSIVAYVGTTIFDTGLNPLKGAMSYGYSFTNAALLKVSPSSEYVGDMAAQWSVSKDALTYTFTLKEGIKFSDGSPMTAEDVVFTYETVQASQAENENVDLTKLASVKALSDAKVAFTLSQPYSLFLDVAAKLGNVPSDANDSEAFDRQPIGTGPWKVVQYDPNQQIILAPNEFYHEGAPSIQRVTIVHMSSDAALSAARSGQRDVVMVSPNYAGETVEGMKLLPLETMDIRQISLPVQPRQERDGVTVGNDVTADKAVRQALAIGIDRADIIQNAYNGVGKSAVSFTDNLVWASTDRYEDGRRDEAAALLERAGWADSDGDGFREKGGLSCAFDVYATEDRYPLAAALAEDAATLGIKITPHASSWDDISANMGSSGVVWGWGQYSPSVIDALFHSRHAYSGGYDNVVAYSNPEVDSLIDRAISSTGREEAIRYWKQAQSVAREDCPYLYIVNIEHCYFVSDRLDISVDTQIPHPHGHGSPILCNLKDWTLK